MPTTVATPDRVETKLWTDDQFLQWLPPGVQADLIDGEIFMHSPVNLRHANLLNFVDRLMAAYIEAKGLGRLYREVVAVKLSLRQVYLPDLAFFTNEQLALLRPTHAPIAPTLVVEALSPETADRDLGPKFAAYEAYGVQEYWILDPEEQLHRFYRREGEMLVEQASGAEVIQAQTVPGFWLKRSWLDPDHLPAVQVCLTELLRA